MVCAIESGDSPKTLARIDNPDADNTGSRRREGEKEKMGKFEHSQKEPLIPSVTTI